MVKYTMALPLLLCAVIVGGLALLPSDATGQMPPPHSGGSSGNGPGGSQGPPMPPGGQGPMPQHMAPPPHNPPGGTPHNPPPPPQNALMAQLGKTIFNDTNLSNPAGMACVTCHAPQVGFTYPNSTINATLGPVPGIVPGRFGNRKPPTISYAVFSPQGPVFNNNIQAYVGGLFFDGRAATLTAQVSFPLTNPNEMNNLTNNVPDTSLVVKKIAMGSYANLFRQVFGNNVFSLPPQQVFPMVAQAVAAYESTPEVSPFSSKYDAYRAGKANLSASEFNGLRLMTGSTSGRPGGPAYKNANCAVCHAIPSDPTTGPDLFTGFAYVNDGVPKNPNNPYYKETNAQTNPLGYNPLGNAYVDLGLGDFLYPANNLPSGNMGAGSNGQGDFLAINGTFKVPTLRNVDKRPSPNFVRAYMHNGVFKSLKDVVHFYNARNLTSKAGEVIDFTKANPYAGLTGTPQFPPPEYASPVTLQNPTGAPASANALVGNLGLTPQEEADIVAFLGTLSDGFFQP